jgi:hypothetical protein
MRMPVSIMNTGMGKGTQMIVIDAGEIAGDLAVGAVGDGDEETMADIEIINENHAVSIQPEGER